MLAAGLQVQLINAPVLEVLAEGQDTHLLHQMQLARAVEVEDGGKGARVAVEEVLVVGQGVVVAEVQQRVVGAALPQLAQARVGHAL